MYTISTPSGTIRNDGAIVLQDDSKPEYLAYVAFLQLGGAPTQIADQEQPAGREHITVTAWQLRQMLIMQGMYDQVKAAVAASGNEMMMTGFEYAAEIHSDSPLLLAILPALGLDEDAMYALFRQAKAL